MKILAFVLGLANASLSAMEIWNQLIVDYENLISPAVHQFGFDTQEQDKVNSSTEIFYLYGFNEQLNFFEISLGYFLQWEDPRLNYESISSDDFLKLPAHLIDSIWAPRLIVENTMQVLQEYSADLVVYRNGTVNYSKMMSLSLACHYNLSLIHI